MKMTHVVLAMLLCLLPAACNQGERVGNAPIAGDVVYLPEIEWRVVDRGELQRVYTVAGMKLTEGQRLQGFAATRGSKIVVYTLPPQSVDDAVTLTLGHEIMHVALGEYHQ